MHQKLYSTFSGNRATCYGSKHEADALAQFRPWSVENGTVVESGLVIHPTEKWLAASSHSIFTSKADGEKYLIEVKLLCLARDCTIDKALSLPACHFQKEANGRRTLKGMHAYYYQMQIGMPVTGCESGVLVM